MLEQMFHSVNFRTAPKSRPPGCNKRGLPCVYWRMSTLVAGTRSLLPTLLLILLAGVLVLVVLPVVLAAAGGPAT